MKTSNRILAQQMSYARRPLSLRAILVTVALITFVIGGGIVAITGLAATTTKTPGRITVDIHTMQRFPTAATQR